MSLVQVDELCVTYGATPALSHVSLRIDPGEIVTIVGPNGSGKTSLLRAIIGAIKPFKGQVSHAHDLKIGYVPQKLHIDETLPITVSRFLNLQEGQTGQLNVVVKRDEAMARRMGRLQLQGTL